jgi:nucleoside 2-deoxyribosyltransferase
MKFYFAGSIRGGRQDRAIYLDLIKHISQYGYVLTEHVGDQALKAWGEKGPDDLRIYERDMAWLEAADIMIAEVTTPSLGVGYEIGRAEALDKPVLCLYRHREGKRLSAMVGGNPNLKVEMYKSPEEARNIISQFIESIADS